jgi:hypothetical protein
MSEGKVGLLHDNNWLSVDDSFKEFFSAKKDILDGFVLALTCKLFSQLYWLLTLTQSQHLTQFDTILFLKFFFEFSLFSYSSFNSQPYFDCVCIFYLFCPICCN